MHMEAEEANLAILLFIVLNCVVMQVYTVDSLLQWLPTPHANAYG